MFAEGVANFYGVLSPDWQGRSPFVSKMLQMAAIVVDEKGSEAAAATVQCFEFECAYMGPEMNFRCDKPFAFVIHNRETKAAVFSGRVINPT